MKRTFFAYFRSYYKGFITTNLALEISSSQSENMGETQFDSNTYNKDFDRSAE